MDDRGEPRRQLGFRVSRASGSSDDLEENAVKRLPWNGFSWQRNS
jgi:hypothetical protein